MKNNYLVQAWLVLCLALCFGAALAGVEAMLADKIEANKHEETMRQIPSLVGGAVGHQRDEIGGRIVYRATDADGRQIGWVVPAHGQGFADTIELLIGLDAKAQRITGLYVLAQKETPGLGNKIIEPSWLEQFAGKPTTAALAVKKTKPLGQSDILAVTGATISSDTVARIVNDTVADLKDELAASVQ